MHTVPLVLFSVATNGPRRPQGPLANMPHKATLKGEPTIILFGGSDCLLELGLEKIYVDSKNWVDIAKNDIIYTFQKREGGGSFKHKFYLFEKTKATMSSFDPPPEF